MQAFYEFTVTTVSHEHLQKDHWNCSSVILSHAMNTCEYWIC